MVVLVLALDRNREIVNSVDTTAFPAAGNLLGSGLEPLNSVRAGGGTGATNVSVVLVTVDHDGVGNSSSAAGIKRSRVENVNTLSETKKLESGKTSLLLKVGGDSALGSSRTDKSLGAFNLGEVSGGLSSNLLVSEEGSSREVASDHGSSNEKGAAESRSNHCVLIIMRKLDK